MYNHFEFSMPETTIDYINSNPPPPSFYGEVYTDYKKINGIVYKSRNPTQSAKYLESFANAESMGMEFDGVDGSEEIMNDEDISNDKSKLIISY